MKISVPLLRRVTNALFDHLESNGHHEIEMEYDHYWNIPAPRIYDANQQPSDFTMGQLSDDLREVTQIDAGQKEPLAYALVWIAALLRYVGERIVS